MVGYGVLPDLVWVVGQEGAMDRRTFAGFAVAGAVLLGAGAVTAAKPPTEWDGLTRVNSKRVDMVYLAPGASVASRR